MRFIPKEEKLYKWLAFLAIAAGIFVRVAVYLQNRNLMIDEANVARNLYERGFAALAMPLSYEQYAPPVFLWITKCFTSLINYGEPALRLFPLLAGIASLFVLYRILKELQAGKAAWYAIALMAVGYIFIRYSSELKQYMGDVLVVLSLILFALRINIATTATRRFAVLWVVIGSLAVWASMPSVFVLAAIGFYYWLQSKGYKNLKNTVMLVGISAVWVLQFAFYYLTILKEQANSAYLQNFHMEYFLFALPGNKDELLHNWNVVNGLLNEAGGFTFLANVLHLLFIAIAVIAAIRKRDNRILLVVIPLAAVIVAAALNQYSLIPRVALFTMPLLLILVAMGFNIILSVRYKAVAVIAVAASFICIKNFSSLSLAWKGYESEQLTDAIDFAMQNSINTGNQLYLHNGARPAFIYYTTIHPDKEKWASVKEAHLLSWDANFDTLAIQSPPLSCFVFTSVYPEDLTNTTTTLAKHLSVVNKQEKPGSYTYIYKHH